MEIPTVLCPLCGCEDEMRRWGQRSPGRLGTKGGHDCPACGLAGGSAAGHPWSEGQGEPTRTNEYPRSRLINRAGRETGPRRPSPRHRLPGALGCTPSLEPSPMWARCPYTVSGGLSLVAQAWPIEGAGSWLPLSMLVHCHCPSSEHLGRPARVAQVLVGWTDSGCGTDPQLSGL